MIPLHVVRPRDVEPADATGPTVPVSVPITHLPFVVDLGSGRRLVVGAPTGQARRWVEAPADSTADVRPRMTLVVDGVVGDTVAMTPGSVVGLGVGGRSVVQVLPPGLQPTAGQVRGSGAAPVTVRFLWRDRTVADPVSPVSVASTGDLAAVLAAGSTPAPTPDAGTSAAPVAPSADPGAFYLQEMVERFVHPLDTVTGAMHVEVLVETWPIVGEVYR